MSLSFHKPASGARRNAIAASATTSTLGSAVATAVAPTELLIAEGKSAAQALDQVRDRRSQGIFMMQGKIPNPETTRIKKLQQHEQCAALLQLLQAPPKAAMASRTSTDAPENTSGYDHVVIVPDADADGLHLAMLLIALFRKYLPAWPAARRLHLFRTPLARIDSNSGHNQSTSIDQPHTQRYLDTAPDVRRWLDARPVAADGTVLGTPQPSLTHFKGLAAINSGELANLIGYPLHSNPRCLQLDIQG